MDLCMYVYLIIYVYKLVEFWVFVIQPFWPLSLGSGPPQTIMLELIGTLPSCPCRWDPLHSAHLFDSYPLESFFNLISPLTHDIQLACL